MGFSERRSRVDNNQCSIFGSKLKALKPLISGCTVMWPAKHKSKYNAVCKRIQN